jgi:hypothetical protein
LLFNINSIITSYRKNLKKTILYKTSYKDTKGLFKNTKFKNNIKYYMAIVDWLIVALAISALSAPTISIVPVTPNSS